MSLAPGEHGQSPIVNRQLATSASMASLGSDRDSHRLSGVYNDDNWSISSNNDMVYMAEISTVQSSDDLQDTNSVMEFQRDVGKRSVKSHLARQPHNATFDSRPGFVVPSSSGDSVTTASREQTYEDGHMNRDMDRVLPSGFVQRDSDSGLPPSASSSLETGTIMTPGSTVGSSLDYLGGSLDTYVDDGQQGKALSFVTLFVRVPAYIAPGQKGRGKILKCTYSPHALVSEIRLGIIENIQRETLMPVSYLRLCRQQKDGSWEWLEEPACLGLHNILTEAQLEMKEVEIHFRDVIINIPQIDEQINLEYDQFSLVADILDAVVHQYATALNAASQSYALYHVRHNTRLALSESMVFYEILSTDKLELKLVQGRAKMVVLTVDIPEAKSQRKIRASLDQTVGDLMSTLIRRLTDISERAWQYFNLYLKPRAGRRAKGMWMEEYKFLSTYNLDEQDVLEYRPKYRQVSFQLRMYPPIVTASVFGKEDALTASQSVALPNTANKPILDPSSPSILVDDMTTNKQVVELLCNSCSFEYPPAFYGLFDHSGNELPLDKQIWDLVPRTSVELPDANFSVHMLYRKIKISQEGEPDSETQLAVDLSWPVSRMLDVMCRRFGIRHARTCGIRCRGIRLLLDRSMMKQDVTEGSHLVLFTLLQDQLEENFSPSSVRSGVDSVIFDVDNMSISESHHDPALWEQAVVPGTEQPLISRHVPNSILYYSNDLPFWDEPADSDGNIRFQSEGDRELVVAGTFNKLVERLTSSDVSDMDFVHTFLGTYQNFTKPEKFFNKLQERYLVVRPEGMPFKEFNGFRTNIQVRTINAIRLWLDTAGDDFVNNESLKRRILEYTEDVVLIDWPKLAGGMRARINEIRMGQTKKNRTATSLDPPPRPKLPSNVGTKVSLFAFDPEEIARQMCLIDFKIYSKILPHEFLNQCWAKPKYKHRAANLLRMIDRMNTVTYWVATTILSQKNKYDRAKRITNFVQIAEQLHKKENFLTMMSVLSGLQHSSIMRLRKTYDKVEKKTMRVHNELCELITPGKNFRQLRALQDNAVPPTLPYIGIFMADLTFIDTGNENILPDGLINFSKCRLISSQIRQILAAQNMPYNYEVISSLEDSLTKMHVLSPEILGEMSLQREPR